MQTPSQRKRPGGGRAGPAGLGDGGGGGGGGEGWGKGLALERRRREWAQLGENRDTRTGACTDISPTSLHNEEQGRSRCRYGIPPEDALKQAGARLECPTINDLPARARLPPPPARAASSHSPGTMTRRSG